MAKNTLFTPHGGFLLVVTSILVVTTLYFHSSNLSDVSFSFPVAYNLSKGKLSSITVSPFSKPDARTHVEINDGSVSILSYVLQRLGTFENKAGGVTSILGILDFFGLHDTHGFEPLKVRPVNPEMRAIGTAAKKHRLLGGGGAALDSTASHTDSMLPEGHYHERLYHHNYSDHSIHKHSWMVLEEVDGLHNQEVVMVVTSTTVNSGLFLRERCAHVAGCCQCLLPLTIYPFSTVSNLNPRLSTNTCMPYHSQHYSHRPHCMSHLYLSIYMQIIVQ